MGCLSTELGDLFGQPEGCEALGNPGSKRWARGSLFPHRIAKDLPNFFFGAAPMAPSSSLELALYTVVEVANK